LSFVVRPFAEIGLNNFFICAKHCDDIRPLSWNTESALADIIVDEEWYV